MLVSSLLGSYGVISGVKLVESVMKCANADI